jgi:hypothetical protein
MRLVACLIAVFLPAILAIGCLTVSPDECWPNTSGGLGGSGTIPIGAAVGATTGDYADPPRGPLDNGGAPYNPCVDPKTPDKPSPKSTCEVPDPAAEGATSWSCSEACSSKCPPPGMGIKIIEFSPSDFPFVTIIQDDGTDKGGGWREARANLEFKDVVARIPIDVTTTWRCSFTIGIPLRTEFKGKISEKLAIDLSIDITESVAAKMNYKLPSGFFCSQYILAVRAAFDAKYKGYGVTVQQ